jgi:hypothetical protein
MKAMYSDAVKRAGKDYSLIQKATEYLAGTVGPSSEDLAPFFGPESLVAAEWDTGDERGRTAYTVKLSGLGSVVTASFEPQELSRDDDNLRWRLRRLWSDLLSATSKAGIKKLGQLVSQLD